MRFSAEWVDGARNVNAEERATLCDLQIFVGNENACVWYDPTTRETYQHVTIPAVHLAEGIASDWWMIFGSRDRSHPILPYRTGFALPNLAFKFDGEAFEVAADPLSSENPQLRFWPTGSAALSRQEAELALSKFIERVVAKLAGDGVRNSEAELCWSRVSQSREDTDESAFCEAAGALGADPYDISEAAASFIEAAGDLFSSETLIEFLAGVGSVSHSTRLEILASVKQAETSAADYSRLPALHEVADAISAATAIASGERVWAPSYRAARAFRQSMGIPGDAIFLIPGSYSQITRRKQLPVRRWTIWCFCGRIARGQRHPYLGLRKLGDKTIWAENFAFARAIGTVMCFPDTQRSVVNALHGAERQASGRAFAAEFLAPVERVLDMCDDGRDVDEISGFFNVSPLVIQHQIENKERILQACAAL